MNMFLRNFIDTLTTRQSENVSQVLQDAVVGKDQIGTIAQRLNNFSGFQALTIGQEKFGNGISSEKIRLNFRDLSMHVAELFTIANIVSILLESSNAILSAEVKAIEDELSAMEKLANNYAFLQSEGGAFNYSYLESFSDELMRENFDFQLTDRSGGEFRAIEQAKVDVSEGVLTLIEKEQISPIPIKANFLESNVMPFITSNESVDKSVDSNSSIGWRMTVRTPKPIRSSLNAIAGRTSAGAQANLEIILAQPSPVSSIHLSPLADQSIEVVRILAFESAEDQSGKDILNSSISLNSSFTFNFPIMNVQRFQIFLNQTAYKQSIDTSENQERKYRSLYESVLKRPKMKGSHSKLRSYLHIKDIMKNDKLNVLTKHYQSLPKIDVPWGSIKFSDIQKSFQFNHNGTNLRGWDNSNVFEKRIWELAWSVNRSWMHPIVSSDVNWQRKGRELGRGIIDDPVLKSDRQLMSAPLKDIDSSIIARNYKYTLGLRSIVVGLRRTVDNQYSFKGVHVSKPLPTSGDIVELRLKTAENVFRLADSDRESDVITSIEYSVSNVARPDKEEHWIPILPIGQNHIEAERVFINDAGHALFRFPASRSGSIALYRDGYRVSLDVEESIIYSPNYQHIIGLRIPNSANNSSSIFTVSYTPAGDPSTINFASRGFSDVPAVSAHDASGGGELFSRTGDRFTVTLNNYPYIDYDQVSSSSYSSLTGLSPYQPVSVQMNSGVTAINLTNYKALNEEPASAEVVSLPSAESGIYFYQSGNVLIFNQELTSPFRVYYQYLESTVRVRTILRVNSTKFISPKVDFWHLKGKTRRPDLRVEL